MLPQVGVSSSKEAVRCVYQCDRRRRTSEYGVKNMSGVAIIQYHKKKSTTELKSQQPVSEKKYIYMNGFKGILTFRLSLTSIHSKKKEEKKIRRRASRSKVSRVWSPGSQGHKVSSLHRHTL